MTRKDLHIGLDELLTQLGFGDTVEQQWGGIILEIKFENGKETIRVKERSTEKILTTKD